MKILYIINKMENLAGTERILSCKMNYLSGKTSHDIYLTTYEQNNNPLSFQLNSKIIYIPINAPIPQRSKLSFFRWVIAYYNTRKQFRYQFGKLLSNIHPDIVISTVYSYEIIDLIIKVSYNRNIKTIFESHIKGDTVSMAKYQYNQILFRLFTFWDYHIMKSLKKCNCIVALTKEDASYWDKYAKRVEVIPNILTISPIRVKDYNSKRVIAAGRYSHQKGFDLLLEAWHLINEKFADWQLYVFGNGERTNYQKIVDKYQMGSNVHLLPATKDIVEEYSNSSIFIMSSRFEGFGLVLAEAMICGLPCISFDCPYGPREIIRDGEDGFLVENGNTEALALAMEHLMSDIDLRRRMGKKAEFNISRYNPDTIMKRWELLFKDL